MNYNEDARFSEKYKQEYLDGLYALIEQREKEGESVREKADLFENAATHRENFKKMLGWPLINPPQDKVPQPTSELLSKENGYSIYRMSFEFLTGVHMYGLFFKHDGDEIRPFSILQHGGEGTPEIISGVLGDTSNYNDMAMRVFREGINVFAPQLVLWNKEKYGAEYDRASIDAKLKRVGSSIAAVEIYAITKILDYFENQSYTKNLGMVGLSYGGFYTLFTHAIDTRLKSAISCSFFNERKKYTWCDWSWKNAAYTYSDAEIACLTYPRKFWIQIGDNDDLFDVKSGIREFERFKKLSSAKEQWVNFTVFSGTHEFNKDNSDVEAFAKELWK